MKKQMRVGVFYVIMFLLLFLAVYFTEKAWSNRGEAYGTEKLVADVQEDKVSAVVIRQNNEVPTGKVIVKFTNEATKEYAVSDVNDVVDVLDEVAPGIYKVTDVEGTSIILTLLPYIFALVL